jgi:uncharacterized protein YndB with AHSA1/START domain
MAEPMNLSESVTVAAPPEAVWDLVTDVTRMGEWSPETIAAWWLGGATTAGTGVRFKGRNKRGRMRWATTCEITAADRGSRFSFVRVSRIDNGTDWTFTMEPNDGGTLLTESARQRRLPNSAARLAGRITFGTNREEQVRQGIRTTIDRIKATAEAGGTPPTT